MEQPSPHQSHPFLPRWCPLQAAARTVTLETRTVFVTIMYLPPWTIPHPRPPCWTRRLPQARISTESGTALAWPPEPSAWTRRIPQQFLEFGEAEAIRPGPSPQNKLPRGPSWHPGHIPTLPFLPSFSRMPLRPQRPLSLERVRRPRVSLQAPRREAQSSGARRGPLFCSRFQAAAVPRAACAHPEPPSSSGASSPGPVGPARSPVQGVGVQEPFPPNTNTRLDTTPSCWPERAVTKARSHSIRKVWMPSPHPTTDLAWSWSRVPMGVQTSGPDTF